MAHLAILKLHEHVVIGLQGMREGICLESTALHDITVCDCTSAIQSIEAVCCGNLPELPALTVARSSSPGNTCHTPSRRTR